jgi:hypothetical protein
VKSGTTPSHQQTPTEESSDFNYSTGQAPKNKTLIIQTHLKASSITQSLSTAAQADFF